MPMFDLQQAYPYFEEVNDGILTLLDRNTPESTAHHKRVLDVGCGRGQLGAAIAMRGYEVWGIESSPEAIRYAQQRLAHCIHGDLTDLGRVSELIGTNRFDIIVFSDVLEHLPDPLATLRGYLKFLAPGGTVLVSLPNVGNWETRLKLLLGRFNYADTGVMDRTHLRFFTFHTATILMQEAGLSVHQIDCTPYIVRAMLPIVKRLISRSNAADTASSIADSSAYKFYLKWVYPVELRLARIWRSALGFRILLASSNSHPTLGKGT